MNSPLAVRSDIIFPAWTEDRAMLGSNPSADPGTQTKGAGRPKGVPLLPVCTALSKTLWDEYQSDKPNVVLTRTAYLSTSSVTFTLNQYSIPKTILAISPSVLWL